jgi:anti-anti-sigma factor
MPESDTHVQSHVEQGVLVLTLAVNQLQDEKLAEALLQELVSSIEQAESRNVVIDLRNIKFISSVAFRPLLHVRRILQDAAGRLVLCGLSTVVGDVFYTTRLVSADGSFAAPFELAADVPAAVALLNREQLKE